MSLSLSTLLDAFVDRGILERDDLALSPAQLHAKLSAADSSRLIQTAESVLGPDDPRLPQFLTLLRAPFDSEGWAHVAARFGDNPRAALPPALRGVAEVPSARDEGVIRASVSSNARGIRGAAATVLRNDTDLSEPERVALRSIALDPLKASPRDWWIFAKVLARPNIDRVVRRVVSVFQGDHMFAGVGPLRRLALAMAGEVQFLPPLPLHLVPVVAGGSGEELMIYEPPDTKYYRRLRPTMTLKDFGIYAESERRGPQLGHILYRAIGAPLHGALFYSPGGAAVVERARVTRNVDASTDKWYRAKIKTNGGAVLGLGMVAEDKNGILMAGAAGKIMIGKSGYFLWTAGVNAEPATVKTPMRVHQIQAIIQHLSEEIHRILGESEAFSGQTGAENRYALDGLSEYLVKAALVEGKWLPPKPAGRSTYLWLEDLVSWSADNRSALAWFLVEKAGIYLGERMRENGWPIAMRGLGMSDDGLVQGMAAFTALTYGDLLAGLGEGVLQNLRAIMIAQSVIEDGDDAGFINLEDIRGEDLPLIFDYIEKARKLGMFNSAVWSDDMQGTGVIAAAGILSWADKTERLKAGNKPLAGIKVMLCGAGAGAYGVYKELVNWGVDPRDIVVTDSGPKKDYSGRPYAIHKGRTDIMSNPFKREMAQGHDGDVDLLEFAKGADVFFNLGGIETVSGSSDTWDGNAWITKVTLAMKGRKGFFGFMTNPDPGVRPKDLHDLDEGAYYASGNQMYENTVNNFTAFGYIGLACLLAGAQRVSNEMTMAAARGIHEVAKLEKKYGQHWLVPRPDDIRLLEHQTLRVVRAAIDSGVSIYVDKEAPEAVKENFMKGIREEIRIRQRKILAMRRKSVQAGHEHYQERVPARYAPVYIEDKKNPIFFESPEIKKVYFERLARAFHINPERWGSLLVFGDHYSPPVLADLLSSLIDSLNSQPVTAARKRLMRIREPITREQLVGHLNKCSVERTARQVLLMLFDDLVRKTSTKTFAAKYVHLLDSFISEVNESVVEVRNEVRGKMAPISEEEFQELMAKHDLRTLERTFLYALSRNREYRSTLMVFSPKNLKTLVDGFASSDSPRELDALKRAIAGLTEPIDYGAFVLMLDAAGIPDDRNELNSLRYKLTTHVANFSPIALARVFEELIAKTEDKSIDGTLEAQGDVNGPIYREIARRELAMLQHLASVSPALGLALGVRRLRMWAGGTTVDPRNLYDRPTIFHKTDVEEKIRELLRDYPKIIAEIATFKVEMQNLLAGKPRPPAPQQPPAGAEGPAPAPAADPAANARSARRVGPVVTTVPVRVVQVAKAAPAVNALDVYRTVVTLAGQKNKRHAAYITANRTRVYTAVERLLERGIDAGRVITALLGYIARKTAAQEAAAAAAGLSGPAHGLPLAPLGGAAFARPTVPLIVQ